MSPTSSTMSEFLARVLASDLAAPARRAARSGVSALRTRLAQPVPVLQPERLYLLLDVLWRTRQLTGAVIEVGCFRGGTTLIAKRFLDRTGSARTYFAIDTFAGFDDEQFQKDTKHGTPASLAGAFSDNSLEQVRRSLDRYGAQGVKLLRGDIATIADSALPDSISVALVDVDLDVPVFEALRKLYPRLDPKGVMLVDDCPEGTTWAGARVGYRRFLQAQGLPELYVFGMGVVPGPEAALDLLSNS
jgi:O-methyltransferase